MRQNSIATGSPLATAAMPYSVGAAYATHGPHRQRPREHVKTRDGFGILPPQFRQLLLSQQQRGEILKIRSETLPVLHQFYRQMRRVRMALRDAAIVAKEDAETVRELTIKLAQLQTKIARQRTDDRRRIFAILDPQQQTRLTQLREWPIGNGLQRDQNRGLQSATPSRIDD